MKALILAAGYGTRLYALGKGTPKALLKVGKKPIIDHILDEINGLPCLNEVIVVTNDKFYKVFEDWAEKQTDYPYPIRVVNDGTKTPEDRLGSIGDIDFVLKQEKVKDDFLVVGGDNIFNFDLHDFIELARTKAPAVTIGLYDVGDLTQAKKFGVVAIDAGRKVTSFEEKPAQPRSTLIAMCFYYFPQETLGLIGSYLKESKTSDRAGDYFRWLYQKIYVYGFKFTGTWYDIGSVETYKEAQTKFKR